MELKVYEIPNNVKNGIYLLINNNEVVYVGKTKSGLKRIMQHNDKTFNKYSFIETLPEELDYYEDFYIIKYQPKYNNFYSYYRISIDSAYRQLKYEIKKQINIKQFKTILCENNIKIIPFKKYLTITKDEYLYIKNKLEKGIKNDKG